MQTLLDVIPTGKRRVAIADLVLSYKTCKAMSKKRDEAEQSASVSMSQYELEIKELQGKIQELQSKANQVTTTLDKELLELDPQIQGAEENLESQKKELARTCDRTQKGKLQKFRDKEGEEFYLYIQEDSVTITPIEEVEEVEI